VLATDDANWGVIRSETSRLNRLVDDLQKVSRAQAHELDLHPSATAPGELVTDAVKAAQPAYAAKHVQLDTQIEPQLPHLDADRERLWEVLADLLTNALRHTATGGTVHVSARQRGAVIELAIADTGEGIAAEHLDRVFERFTESIRHARAPAAAPASAWRSSARSSKRTAAPPPPRAPESVAEQPSRSDYRSVWLDQPSLGRPVHRRKPQRDSNWLRMDDGCLRHIVTGTTALGASTCSTRSSWVSTRSGPDVTAACWPRT
jgi:hypothetical protein